MYPLVLEDNSLVVGTRAVQRASTLSVSRQHCLTHKTPMEDKECNTLHHPLHLSSPPPHPLSAPSSEVCTFCQLGLAMLFWVSFWMQWPVSTQLLSAWTNCHRTFAPLLSPHTS